MRFGFCPKCIRNKTRDRDSADCSTCSSHKRTLDNLVGRMVQRRHFGSRLRIFPDCSRKICQSLRRPDKERKKYSCHSIFYPYCEPIRSIADTKAHQYVSRILCRRSRIPRDNILCLQNCIGFQRRPGGKLSHHRIFHVLRMDNEHHVYDFISPV